MTDNNINLIVATNDPTFYESIKYKNYLKMFLLYLFDSHFRTGNFISKAKSCQYELLWHDNMV